MNSDETIKIGSRLFRLRDYTPIPVIILVLFFASPGIASITTGMCLIFIGELIRLYSVAFIGSISRTRSHTTGGQLITTGPFAFVRNPLYLGNFLITLGFSIYAGNLFLIVLIAAAFWGQYYFIIKFEEQILFEKFGAEYDEYRQNVPALLPIKLPRLSEIEWPTTFSPAIKSEKRTMTAIVAMLIAFILLSKTK